MRILITGGAGFIGSHLAGELLDRGDEVFIIDNLSTGLISNMKHLEGNSKFHFVLGSVEHEVITEKLVMQCDQIYHLAAAVGVKLIVKQPIQTIGTNISATEVVLRLASKYEKKVLITSTSEVYGKSSKDQFSEDDDLIIGMPGKYRWAYAASKIVDEFLAMAYWHKKKLPVTLARLFNVVGPRQQGQYGMVIPCFVSQALSGAPITVYGDGEQTRCFLYVKDAVRGLVDLMNSSIAVGRVFNIGNPHEISINKLAKLIKEIVGSNSEIRHIPYEEAYSKGFEDMKRRVPNIDRAVKEIGFQAMTSLEQIINEVSAFLKNELVGNKV